MARTCARSLSAHRTGSRSDRPRAVAPCACAREGAYFRLRVSKLRRLPRAPHISEVPAMSVLGEAHSPRTWEARMRETMAGLLVQGYSFDFAWDSAFRRHGRNMSETYARRIPPFREPDLFS